MADDGPISGQAFDPVDYRYLACDAACTSGPNWSDTLVYSDTANLPPESVSPFAISPDGTGAATAIATPTPFGASGPLTVTAIWFCRSTCTSPGGWASYTPSVTNQTNANASLTVNDMALGSDQVLRVLDTDLSTESLSNPAGDLTLQTCSSDCSVAGNWSAVRIAAGGTARLAITEQNGLRVIQYALNPNPVPGTEFDIFTYIACDSQCSTSSSWKSASINASIVPGNSAGGIAQGEGDDLDSIGGDFAFRLNSRGLPVIAYQNTQTSGYASCSGACDPAGTWTVTKGPSDADLAIDLESQVPGSCASVSWTLSGTPSLAFDVSGSPVVELGASGQFSPQQCSTPDTSTQNLVLAIS